MSGELIKSEANLRQLISQEKVVSAIKELARESKDYRRHQLSLLLAAQAVPQLLNCTQASVMGSFLNAVRNNVEIAPGSAYLIPYGENCTLVIDYRAKISWLAEAVDQKGNRLFRLPIYADVVCKNDVIREIYNPKKLDFQPDNFCDRGEVLGAFACVTYESSGEQDWVLMKWPEDFNASWLKVPEGKRRNLQADKGQFKEWLIKTCYHRLARKHAHELKLGKLLYSEEEGEEGRNNVIDADVIDLIEPTKPKSDQIADKIKVPALPQRPLGMPAEAGEAPPAAQDTPGEAKKRGRPKMTLTPDNSQPAAPQPPSPPALGTAEPTDIPLEGKTGTLGILKQELTTAFNQYKARFKDAKAYELLHAYSYDSFQTCIEEIEAGNDLDRAESLLKEFNRALKGEKEE